MTILTQRDRAQQLFELADAQAGYFTAHQALDLGYAYPTQHHHQRVGHWQRAGHGLYRLTAYPITEHEQLAQLTLWSRTRAGETQAVVSHDTALSLHGVSDLLPEQLHLTVPCGFRKPAPVGVVLHVGTLRPEEVETRHGFSMTTLERTLLDLAEEGRHVDLLEQAIEVAAAQGAIGKATAGRLKGMTRGDQR